MAQVDQGLSDREQMQIGRSLIEEKISSTRISNVLMGIVISRASRLLQSRLRIRIGEHTDLHVYRQTLFTHGTVDIGQTVYVTIPEEAVHLEFGAFRRGKQRLNRWIGRVVLVNWEDKEDMVVKLHRESITLKSGGPVLGARDSLSVWDTVNIVVDPQQVGVVPFGRASRSYVE